MQTTPDGPYRLRYEDVATGELHTMGFPTNNARFDWAVDHKTARIVEWLNPEPDGAETAIPATISDAGLADHLSYSSAGRKLLDEFVDAQPDDGAPGPIHYREVGVWIRDHMDDLNLEGNRRELSIPELLVGMLDDVFSIYQDVTDEEVAEEVATRKTLAARDKQMRARGGKDHVCRPNDLGWLTPNGVPGVCGVCRTCGLEWFLRDGHLYPHT
jgi:hypothetical protein